MGIKGDNERHLSTTILVSQFYLWCHNNTPFETALTTNELIELWGFGERKTRKIIKLLLREGRIAHTKITRLNIGGDPYPRHAYFVKDVEENKKKKRKKKK